MKPWEQKNQATAFNAGRIFTCIGTYLIGIAYIFQNNNSSPDTQFYYEVAKNILAGCGFALNTSSGCQPLIGGYFPGYPSMVAATLLVQANSEKLLCLLVYTLQVMASLRLAKCIDSADIVSKNGATLIFAIATISPLHFGFSRFALIEPSLAVASTLLMSEYLLFVYKKRRSVFTNTTMICILIGIYFKPTFAAIIPILVIAEIKYSPENATKRILRLFGFLIVISALVSPWLFRQSMHGSDNISMYSNRVQPGMSEYRKWTRLITITEYDHASYHFDPGNNHDQNGNIRIPFLHPWAKISDADFRIVNSVITQGHPAKTNGFNEEEVSELQAAADIRRELSDPFRLLVISALQSASLLFHPFNSWGFPLEIKSMVDENSIVNGTFNSAGKLLAPISGKLLLWLYRVQVASVYILKLARSRKDRKTIALKPRSCINILFMTGMSIIVIHLIMYVGLFNQLEHRYISPFAIWIEIGPAIYLLKLKEAGPMRA